jgi:hypothetical protein
MKPLTFLFVFLSLAHSARSQKDPASQDFIKSSCKQVVIRLHEDKKRPDTTSPFSTIEVMDARPDTTRIGLVVEHNSRKELLLNKPVSTVLAAHLNNHYSNPQGNQPLLVIIKKLYLFDSSLIKKANGSGFTSSITAKMIFRAEAYLKVPQGYLPLTYLDTVISSPYGPESMATFRLPVVLEVFMEKAVSADLAAVIKRNRLLSYLDIDKFNKARFAFPMDTAVDLKKGVYASLEEFKNNQPSTKEYEITKDEQGNMELNIRDEQGKLYYTHTMWGFCDGQHCFVMMDGNLFPILPVDHEWYVWGTKEYAVKRFNTAMLFLFPAGYIAASVPVSESVTRKMRFFRLDTESGEIY